MFHMCQLLFSHVVKMPWYCDDEASRGSGGQSEAHPVRLIQLQVGFMWLPPLLRRLKAARHLPVLVADAHKGSGTGLPQFQRLLLVP